MSQHVTRDNLPINLFIITLAVGFAIMAFNYATDSTRKISSGSYASMVRDELRPELPQCEAAIDSDLCALSFSEANRLRESKTDEQIIALKTTARAEYAKCVGLFKTSMNEGDVARYSREEATQRIDTAKRDCMKSAVDNALWNFPVAIEK